MTRCANVCLGLGPAPKALGIPWMTGTAPPVLPLPWLAPLLHGLCVCIEIDVEVRQPAQVCQPPPAGVALLGALTSKHLGFWYILLFLHLPCLVLVTPTWTTGAGMWEEPLEWPFPLRHAPSCLLLLLVLLMQVLCPEPLSSLSPGRLNLTLLHLSYT